MNTFQLTCFLAVVDTLNFARAAEQLHVTQPAVTQQIHSLEKELNVKLFRRTTRSVRVTEEGFMFLDDARRIVETSRRAQQRFQELGRTNMRVLNIGSYSESQIMTLLPALRKLREPYPDLHPRLRIVPFQHLYRLLEEGEMDAVAGFREPASKKIAASYKEVLQAPIICVCAPDHPLASKACVSLSDLREHRLILQNPSRAQSDAARIQGELMNGRPPSELYFCETMEEAVLLVVAGYGAAILPELFITPNLNIARIPIQGVEPVSFGLYYKSVKGNEPLRDLIRLAAGNKV